MRLECESACKNQKCLCIVKLFLKINISYFFDTNDQSQIIIDFVADFEVFEIVV